MELTQKQKDYCEAVEANTPEGCFLSPGWPLEAHGINHASYIDWAHDLLDELAEGEDVGSFQTFQEWVEMTEDENPNRDDLGFSHLACDLCGGSAGDRFAVTALPLNPDNRELTEFYALSVCSDCIQYIANGELPEG